MPRGLAVVSVSWSWMETARGPPPAQRASEWRSWPCTSVQGQRVAREGRGRRSRAIESIGRQAAKAEEVEKRKEGGSDQKACHLDTDWRGEIEMPAEAVLTLVELLARCSLCDAHEA